MECLRRFLSELAGRQLEFDKQVYKSEVKTAFRNLSIGYMLRTVGVLDSDPVEIVNGYIKQCAIKVTVKDLANICSVLANGGVQAKTGKQLLERDVVRQVLSVMMTCGMYDAAGDWLDDGRNSCQKWCIWRNYRGIAWASGNCKRPKN